MGYWIISAILLVMPVVMATLFLLASKGPKQ